MLLALVLVAVAEEQRVVYDVFIGKEDVGDRELAIRYLPRDDGERRVISLVSTATTPLGAMSARASAQSGPRGASFTTSQKLGESLSQVQGVLLPDGGWQIVRSDATGVYESTLSAEQVRMTTLDVYDPGRARLLTVPGRIHLLVAETAEMADGNLLAPEEVSVKIDGKTITATRCTIEEDGEKFNFYFDAEMVLLRSDFYLYGAQITTKVRTLPEPRNYGTIEAIASPGAGIKEAEL
ncbi:MAG: hypothetical protein FJ090_07545 [Deltaproteobacteria bacterium]|nr:hypothetical protein [Deltaproteobacteria bacterium]